MSCGCGCAQGMAGVDGGECDKPVNFGVWPSDVDVFKRRLLPIVTTMDLDVAKCEGLNETEKAGWLAFSLEAKAFFLSPTGVFGSYDAWTQCCSYAHTIDGWQEKLTKQCKLSTPTNVHGATLEALSPIMWIAGAVIAVALVVGVSKVTDVIPSAKRKR